MKENKISKMFFGTLLYGVIINFIILTILDHFDKSAECLMRSSDGDGWYEGTCTIYPLLLIISILLGGLISIIFIKIENHRK